MSYIYKEGTSIYDVIDTLDMLLTVTQGTWSRVLTNTTKYEGKDRLSEVIWKGIGGGSDIIYLHVYTTDAKTMVLDSMVGYDALLMNWEQPGSIMQQNQVWLKKGKSLTEYTLPVFSIVENEKFSYWVFVNNYRAIVVSKLSTYYESMYMGFINPIAVERQYPYPMYVCGNGRTGQVWPNTQSGSFVFPTGGSGWLRRVSGDWRKFECTESALNPRGDGTVFPENAGNKKLVPNYTKDDADSTDNFILIPIILQTFNPVDMCGIMQDVCWISGTRDVSSEQLLTFNGDSYMIFDTKDNRTENSYYAIKMA